MNCCLRIQSSARRHGVAASEVEDYAREFLDAKLKSAGVAGTAILDGDIEQLMKEAEIWTAAKVLHERRERHRIIALSDNAAIEMLASLSSHEEGPEETALRNDVMAQILRATRMLTPGQDRLFRRHYIDRIRMVDLQVELGRTAQALGAALVKLRKHLRLALEADGLDTIAADSLLNMFDRMHGPG